MVFGGGVSFLFAVAVFYSAVTKQSVLDVITDPLGHVRRTTPEVLAFGEEVNIFMGNAATFEDGLVVTASSFDDSRCPQGVQCIWAGELSVTFDIKYGRKSPDAGKEAQIVLGQLASPKVSAPPYEFALVNIAWDERVATFSVSIK